MKLPYEIESHQLILFHKYTIEILFKIQQTHFCVCQLNSRFNLNILFRPHFVLNENACKLKDKNKKCFINYYKQDCMQKNKVAMQI